MNPTAIYSKSGKGVQEASGKTSFLNRADRAVLSAIDGRATLNDVAQKVGKPFDNAFKDLIGKLDKEGFIREASPGAAAGAPKPAAAKPAAGKPAAKAGEDPGGDLDFSSLGIPAAKPAAPSRPSAPPPPPPKPAAPKPDPALEAQARAQQSALQKAREEAEARAQAERDRLKAEAEAKMRSELEAKARDEAAQKLKEEAEARTKAETEAKIKAAREAAARAAAEAKAKADAEAKAKVEAERKAREEAERARQQAEEEARRAREEAERARKAAEEEARRAREEAERARKEAEEAARKAREEAERKAREEAEAMRRQLEEERKRLEEERRRDEEERAARRKREEEEEAARKAQREEDERRADEERAAKRRQREEAEEAERAEAERAAAERAARAKAAAKKDPEPAPAKSQAAGSLDSLMADLDSFTTREDEERKEKEEAERKAKEAAAQRAREEAERQEREEAERRRKEEARARKEEQKRKKREEEEALARKREEEEDRLREEEEKRKREMEERARKAREEEQLAARANRAKVSLGEDTDEVRKRMLGRPGGAAAGGGLVAPSARRKGGWGKSLAITLFLLLAGAVAAVHFMPVPMQDYERAAAEALGRKVTIREGNLSLVNGLQLKLKDIQIGDDVRIATAIAVPELDSLRSEKKSFSRIELSGVKLTQDAIGAGLAAKVKGENFSVARIVLRGLELDGPVRLPAPLEAELAYAADGALATATVRGPDALLARITPTGGNAYEFVVTASGFAVPFVPEVTLTDFGMKGTASARGLTIPEWGGKVYGGSLTGNANVRWGGGWNVDGVMTTRNINAAVFAPALLSEGRAEGTGRFSMSGPDPAQLGTNSRVEGSFTINSGVLGSFDLGRVIRSSGKEYAGRTQFSELTGQLVYDRGAVQIRNVTIGAGQLNAGASLDISQGGSLSGRIVADVKSDTGRAVNATLQLGGTVKEPRVRN